MVIYTGITDSGVRYSIDDSYAAPKGSLEEARVIQEQRRAAYDILVAWAMKHEGRDDDGCVDNQVR